MSAIGGGEQPYFKAAYNPNTAEAGIKLTQKKDSGIKEKYLFAGKILKPEGQELGKRDTIKLFFSSINHVRIKNAEGKDTNMLININDVAQQTGLTPAEIKESNERGALAQTIMDKMRASEVQNMLPGVQNEKGVVVDKNLFRVLDRINHGRDFKCILFVDPETKQVKEGKGPITSTFWTSKELKGTVPVRASIGYDPEKNQYTIQIQQIEMNQMNFHDTSPSFSEIPKELKEQLINSPDEFLKEVLKKAIS